MTKQKIKEIARKVEEEYGVGGLTGGFYEDFAIDITIEALKQQKAEIREMINEVMITRDARWTKKLLKALDNLD